MDPPIMEANLLLARFPAAAREQLLRVARLEEVPIRTMLATRGRPLREVSFPVSGMASVVMEDETGAATEAATVGREGMIGASALYDEGPSLFGVMWQLPGSAIVVGTERLREVAAAHPTVLTIVARSVIGQLAQTTQNAGCNRVHDLEQRAAKWLLLTRDRADADAFPLIQAFLAIMLGVTRPKLSLVESILERAGYITRRRGTVTIVDRPSLEAQSCECYAIIRDAMARGVTADRWAPTTGVSAE
jgi:CRP-like cAMP-binding protein